jgi:hypothetical protein
MIKPITSNYHQVRCDRLGRRGKEREGEGRRGKEREGEGRRGVIPLTSIV